MTIPITAAHQAVKTVTLPAPGYPMVTRMITNALFPETRQQPETEVIGCPHCKNSITITKTKIDSKEPEPIIWIVGEPHPLVPDMKVMRMFVDRGGVEVYSVSSDGKAGMRNLVPMGWTRLVEEAMPLDIFIEELNAAESDEPEPDDPEPEGDSEPEPEPAPEPAPTVVVAPNGSPS
jgi:hypothetical protein